MLTAGGLESSARDPIRTTHPYPVLFSAPPRETSPHFWKSVQNHWFLRRDWHLSVFSPKMPLPSPVLLCCLCCFAAPLPAPHNWKQRRKLGHLGHLGHLPPNQDSASRTQHSALPSPY